MAVGGHVYSGGMGKRRKRAVRMVFGHTAEYPSEWSAIRWITEKFGMTGETL